MGVGFGIFWGGVFAGDLGECFLGGAVSGFG